MGSNPNTPLPIRSISDIMSPYRNFFRDIDFRYVLSQLISREEFLTRDFNLHSMRLERERRQLRRELSAFKDREAEGIRVLELEKHELFIKLETLQSSSIECNDRIKALIRNVDQKNDEISRLMEKLSDIHVENEKSRVLLGEFKGVVRKVEFLEKEKSEIEVKLGEFRRENECLVADKVKFDEKLRKLESVFVGIKDEIERLRRVLGEKNKEICGKDERIEALTREVEVLEKEKSENKVKFDEIRRENKSLVTAVDKVVEEFNKLDKLKEFCRDTEYFKVMKEKSDKEIEVLRRKVEVLEKRKAENEVKFDEIQRENEYLTAKMAKSDEESKSLRKEINRKIMEMKKKNEAEVESLGREKEVEIDELKKKVEGLEMEKIELMKENEEKSRNYEKMEQQVVKLEEDVARLLLGNVPNPNKLTDDQIEKVLSCVFDGIDSEEDGGIDRAEKIQRGAPVASSSKPAVSTTSGLVTEVSRETKRQRVLSQCSNRKHQSDDTSDKSELIAACRRSRRL